MYPICRHRVLRILNLGGWVDRGGEGVEKCAVVDLQKSIQEHFVNFHLVTIDPTDQGVVDGDFEGVVWPHNKTQQVSLKTK